MRVFFEKASVNRIPNPTIKPAHYRKPVSLAEAGNNLILGNLQICLQFNIKLVISDLAD